MTVKFIKLSDNAPAVLRQEIIKPDDAAARSAVEESFQKLRKGAIEKIVADRRFAQIANYTGKESLPNCEAINRYFLSLFVPHFGQILGCIGHAKMQQLLKNLIQLNEETSGLLNVSVALLSEKFGLGTIKSKWDLLCHGAKCERAALWDLLIEVEDLSLTYPALESLLPSNLRMIFSFYKQAKKTLSDGIDEGLNAFFGQDVEFSKFVKHYSHLNGAAFREELVRGALMPRLPLEKFDDAEFLRQALNKSKAQIAPCREAPFVAKIRDAFETRYGGYFAWLKKNRTHLKRVLNQGDSPHINVNGGVCYENCYERLRAHLAGGESACLEGSVRGRRVRATKNLLSALNKGAITEKTADKLGPASFGLKKSQPSVDLDRLDALGSLLKSDPRPFILTCNSSNRTGGHAINVQYDQARGVYLFIDDNYGVFEYASAEERNKELLAYLKVLYSYYDKFRAVYLNLR